MLRVLLVSRYSLFRRGIQSLLCQEPGLTIIGQERDPDEAIERIRELRPDVVIADSQDTSWDPESLLLRIWREELASTVIGLNLKESTLRLYHREERLAKGVEDLVAAIKMNPAK